MSDIEWLTEAEVVGKTDWSDVSFCDCCSPLELSLAVLKAKKKSKPFHGYNPNKHHRKGGLNANRYARIAFAQRSKVETAKTTTKRAALVANAVQKTPTYPIDENHAQSTTMAVMRPSAKSNTIAAIGTPKRLQGMLPHIVSRSKSETGNCCSSQQM